MGSYSSNIIQMPNQSPFDITQNPIANAYLTAMMKKKFDNMDEVSKQARKDAQYQKYLNQAKATGAEIEQGFTDSGPTFKTKEPDKLENTDISQAMAGLASDSANKTIANRLGANKYQIAAQNPNAAMSLADGNVGTVNEQPITPTPMDTRNYVAGALGGIPSLQKKATQKAVVPDTFKTDVQSAMDSSQGDESMFVGHLQALKGKYADNVTALDSINKILSGHAKSKKGGRPSRQ